MFKIKPEFLVTEQTQIDNPIQLPLQQQDLEIPQQPQQKVEPVTSRTGRTLFGVDNQLTLPLNSGQLNVFHGSLPQQQFPTPIPQQEHHSPTPSFQHFPPPSFPQHNSPTPISYHPTPTPIPQHPLPSNGFTLIPVQPPNPTATVPHFAPSHFHHQLPSSPVPQHSPSSSLPQQFPTTSGPHNLVSTLPPLSNPEFPVHPIFTPTPGFVVAKIREPSPTPGQKKFFFV